MGLMHTRTWNYGEGGEVKFQNLSLLLFSMNCHVVVLQLWGSCHIHIFLSQNVSKR